ncbi:ABC transporter ATP-binding protein [Pelagibacterales bacterium SAG-MED20]|nr:ABC transporter ATP-binding protein [Pelagibacterales bacterium SAG-MED20]
MVVAGFLEMLSIGIMIPLVNIIFNPEGTTNEVFSSILKSSKDSLSLNYISLSILAIFFVYLLKYLFLVFYTFFQSKVLLVIKAELSKKLFNHYLTRDYTFHFKNSSAKLIRNTIQEVDTLMNSFVGPFFTFFLLLLMSMFVLGLLFYYSFVSSLIVLFIFGMFGISLALFIKNKIRIIGKRRQKHAFGSLKNLQEGFSLIREIKLLAIENFFQKKFNLHINAMIPLGIKRTVFGILPKIIFEFIFITIALGMIVYINFMKLPFEEFFTIFVIYVFAAYRIIPSLSGLSVAYQKMKFGVVSLELIIKELEDKKHDTKIFTNIKNDNFKFEEEIEAKDISFKYENNKNLVLDKLNLKIKKNTCIGLVGRNAAGKSTLINLICGLINPINGEISVDQKNIINDINGWQKLIGFIPQSIYLIDDSVQNNIALGISEENIDKERVKKMMVSSGLSETLSPEDLVGEGGKNISGGQKQKIGIARALYRQPEILIYDEPTSAMDLDSEEHLTETIFNQNKEKTLIIISHREKVLRYCDFVYKLENKNISQVDLKNINLNKLDN